MRYVTNTPLKPICFPTKMEPPGDTMVGVIKATVDLVPGGTATLAEGQIDIEAAEKLFEDKLGNSCRYDGDLAPFKPRADLLLTGNCHPPGGAATRCDVTFQVGAWRKSLAVFGDRFWLASENPEVAVASEPRRFARMPLRYELALGDAEDKANPHGRGFHPEQTEDGRTFWPLPNIELPQRLVTSTADRPPPAGLTPLDQMAPLRWRKRGTYDEKWMRRRRPYPPTDIDWGCWNAAPMDQQVDGYLKGTETIRLVNLDREAPDYRTTLPGIRPRWFLHLVTPQKRHFLEVPLNLDTLWVDADARQAVLIWRGKAPVPQGRDESEDASLFFHDAPGEATRSREDAWAMYLGEVEPPVVEPEPPKLSEAEQKEIDELLDQARQTLKEGGAPDDLLALVEKETDPSQFETKVLDWAKAHFNVPDA